MLSYQPVVVPSVEGTGTMVLTIHGCTLGTPCKLLRETKASVSVAGLRAGGLLRGAYGLLHEYVRKVAPPIFSGCPRYISPRPIRIAGGCYAAPRDIAPGGDTISAPLP